MHALADVEGLSNPRAVSEADVLLSVPPRAVLRAAVQKAALEAPQAGRATLRRVATMARGGEGVDKETLFDVRRAGDGAS